MKPSERIFLSLEPFSSRKSMAPPPPPTRRSTPSRPPTPLIKRLAIPLGVVGIVIASGFLYRTTLNKRSLDKRAARKEYPNPL